MFDAWKYEFDLIERDRSPASHSPLEGFGHVCHLLHDMAQDGLEATSIISQEDWVLQKAPLHWYGAGALLILKGAQRIRQKVMFSTALHPSPIPKLSCTRSKTVIFDLEMLGCSEVLASRPIMEDSGA